MLSLLGLPTEIIVFDTEFTAWEGSLEQGWSGLNEHREIVQIGAVRLDTRKLAELDVFDCIVRPAINPKLSDYFIQLTGITQEEVDRRGLPYSEAIKCFYTWAHDLTLYSWGRDEETLLENCKLYNIEFPFSLDRFKDTQDIFRAHGVATDGLSSGTIVRAFDKPLTRRPHNALNDARTTIDGLRELEAKLRSRG